MKPTMRSVMRIKSMLNKERGAKGDKALLEYIQEIWSEGYADRIAVENNVTKEDHERMIVVSRCQKYNIECPTCGQTIEVDFDALSKDATSDHIQEAMDACGWGKVDIEAELEYERG